MVMQCMTIGVLYLSPLAIPTTFMKRLPLSLFYSCNIVMSNFVTWLTLHLAIKGGRCWHAYATIVFKFFRNGVTFNHFIDSMVLSVALHCYKWQLTFRLELFIWWGGWEYILVTVFHFCQFIFPVHLWYCSTQSYDASCRRWPRIH